MPNSFITQNQLNQKEYQSLNQSLTEERVVSNISTKTSPSAQSNSPELLNDDWSSLTKELIDTLPQVWTRGLLYFLVIFVAIILPWAMLSKVDQTGSARGRLEPKGKTLKLDAPVAGTVASIQVKEGQTVKTGQILLELESEITRAELQQAQAKLEGEQNREAQLALVKNQLEIAVRTQQLQSQAQESEQLAQLGQIRQRLNSSKKLYALEQERLTVTKNDLQRHRFLWQEGAISKSKLEEVQSSTLERQRLLEQAQSDIQQAATELEKQQSAAERIKRTGELAVLESQTQLKELQSQILDVRAEIAQTEKLIESLQFQFQQRVLRAPINGTIFQLQIENPGSVLQPSQTIAQIAPQEAPLVFRAEIPAGESGFLQVGMPVKLKFDAYPFQDYGVVSGHLRWISPDSKVVDTSSGKIETFELEVVLSQTYIQTENKRVALRPGQTATAEVIVRQRRIIDFILDPFKKLQKGGLEL
ncbi:MAG TPA: HlyD family secretion protein [Cyanobacteria bacterium UBA12227]|nr:HlyD family secretion protein [Cyanobacteria bacterium UBA12227]HAX89325.1 HlyD family secretion protein [Cyanobacteria bacterium UBA11370]HBY77012.1 HlyD family secretion protein [Cyanobacteria bacterium UBA11148]